MPSAVEAVADKSDVVELKLELVCPVFVVLLLFSPVVMESLVREVDVDMVSDEVVAVESVDDEISDAEVAVEIPVEVDETAEEPVVVVLSKVVVLYVDEEVLSVVVYI